MKTDIKPLIQTSVEKKLLTDLFSHASKVSKALNDTIRTGHAFTIAEMDLLVRLSTLFSEVSRRPVTKGSEKQIALDAGIVNS